MHQTQVLSGGLVAQYDVLTDGASSVYGSDAIGGVTNVILKQIDGLRIELNGTKPKYSGADNRNVSITWGETYDKGFVGFGLIMQNKPIPMEVGPDG